MMKIKRKILDYLFYGGEGNCDFDDIIENITPEQLLTEFKDYLTKEEYENIKGLGNA